jgi:SAM-dependent methyltransferase
MADLLERIAREKASYDGGSVHSESSKLQARFHHVFSCPNTMRKEEYLSETASRCSKGADILDYGCYNGWMVSRYLEMGPRSITGIDISETAIAEAKQTFGDRASFYAGDAHNMPFPDNSFDLVVGRSILHHLQLDIALREILRVLRPGGYAVFTEPLGDNPGAKLLRALTPKARTRDEAALRRIDILRADSLFGGSSHSFFNLLSVPVAMLTSLTTLSPSCLPLRWADILDQKLARTPLKFWMRQAVLVWRKA